MKYRHVFDRRTCLKGAGIPALVADAQLVQTDPLLSPALRGASLRVPAERVAEARELLAAVKRGDFELGDDFEPGAQKPG